MVISGIVNVVWDSRILQNQYKRIIRRSARTPTTAQTLELGENNHNEEQSTVVDHPVTEPTDVSKAVVSASGVTSSHVRSTASPEDEQVSNSREREPHVVVPFSVRTGAISFALFLVSLVIILVVRGVVADVPPLFRFFANIYLAGNIPL
jgi:hypothetical protein